MTEPAVAQLELPPEYGKPSKLLSWDDVRQRLEEAQVYWVASVRPDGRPHVVPRDGIWLDDSWYYGGSEKTVHNRNITGNPQVTMHIGDGMQAIIVEGTVEHAVPSPETATRLADVNNTKYAHYGMKMTPESYAGGVWTLHAARVIAWNELFTDATRFTFS